MRLRTWAFCLNEAGQNLWRNPVLAVASITTTTVALLVLGVFLLLSVNVNAIATSIEGQVAVQAFFAQSVPQAQEQQDLQQVRQWSQVRTARFISRDQALQELKKEFGSQATVLDSLGSANPLEDSLSVTAKTPRDVQPLARRLAGLAGVVHTSYQSAVVSRLFALVNAVRYAGLAIGLLLLLGSLLVINNAIRLGMTARRREISIMRLVGATESLVHWPFILEGLILGLVGAVVASGLSFWSYVAVYRSAVRTLPFLPLVDPSPLPRDIALGLLGLGIVLGAVGFRLSVRRLAKV